MLEAERFLFRLSCRGMKRIITKANKKQQQNNCLDTQGESKWYLTEHCMILLSLYLYCRTLLYVFFSGISNIFFCFVAGGGGRFGDHLTKR